MSIIVATVFFLAQALLAIFIVVIRYHLRRFAVPGDAGAQRISRLATRGFIVLSVAAGAMLVFVLVRGLPPLPDAFKAFL